MVGGIDRISAILPAAIPSSPSCISSRKTESLDSWARADNAAKALAVFIFSPCKIIVSEIYIALRNFSQEQFMKKYLITIILLLAFASNAHSSEQFKRDQIKAVGSSTVYPFIAQAAENFARDGKFKSPIVESTGTGGGFKLFCAAVDENSPDIINASRKIKEGEVKLCAANKISNPLEIKIGYDGIVIANAKAAKKLDLTLEQLFLALAKQVPVNGKLVDNPYKKWSDIDKALPAVKIEVYGPPPTSGTRDSFVELVMEKSCMKKEEFAKAYTDKDSQSKACKMIREDGGYVEAGENDNLIIQKLNSNHDAFGILGYSYLEKNHDKVKAAIIDGIAPSFENISSNKYEIARPLYVYFKNEHMDKMAGMKEFLRFLISDETIGVDGDLALTTGLIPLHEDELKELQSKYK